MAATNQSRTPLSVRLACRHGSLQDVTAGLASGFLQAGLAGLPRSLADDFAEFSALNYGPFPLLYKSAPGETEAPLLAKDSDVRYGPVVFLLHGVSAYVTLCLACALGFLAYGGVNLTPSIQTSFLLNRRLTRVFYRRSSGDMVCLEEGLRRGCSLPFLPHVRNDPRVQQVAVAPQHKDGMQGRLLAECHYGAGVGIPPGQPSSSAAIAVRRLR